MLAGLAHLNHQLRPEAERDEAFCRALADAAGVPCDVGAGRRRRRGGAPARWSVEVAGRDARYAFFEQVRASAAAPHVVAVAHTRDDQAETVLMRLLRGTGHARPARRAAVARRDGAAVAPVRARRTARLPRGARRSLAGGRDQRRPGASSATASATTCCRGWFATTSRGAARMLARTAELAHDDDAYLTAAADTAAAVIASKASGGWMAGNPAAAGPAAGNRAPCGPADCSGRPAPPAAVRLADVDRVLAACRGAQAARCRGGRRGRGTFFRGCCLIH